jgi:pimeloyl-ACP methyl ester carboxylesterase
VNDGTTLERHRRQAHGLELECLETGPADGPLALCLHGYPDSAHTFRHLLPHLAEAGFRAVAPFLRGYAPSDLDPASRYQCGVLGLDANALHDTLGADGRAVIVGHDWGALGTYAAANLEPDRWSKVVAAAVPPGPVSAMGMLSYEQQKRSWYMFFQTTPLADLTIPMNGYEFIARLWADWSPGYDAVEDVAHFIECMATPEHLAAALGYYRQTLDASLQSPELAEAQAATMAIPPQPLLYLHGREDGCMGAELADLVAGMLTVEGSRSMVLDGVGHFLHLEQPEVVDGLILEHLTA